jgi:septal ring factor EnvC (AmiA/AmiB activator)
MLKNNDHNIVLYIVAALLVYLIFTTNGIKTDIKGYKQNIENIQTKVDSAKTIDQELVYKIDSVKQKVVTINNDIHHIDKTITTVKIKTNEKTNTINKFSNPELEYFFANRYNNDYNGSKN